MLKQNRDPWMIQTMTEREAVGFYDREFYIFSNFAATEIVYDDITYPTTEHAYQALKFRETNPDIFRMILETPSPHEAKKLAARARRHQDPEWESKKLEVMEALLRKKLKRHSYVAKKLLQTSGHTIYEDSPYDSYWGIGKDGSGENHLGKLWMKLRAELEDRMRNETNIFLESVKAQVNRNPHLRAARIIVQALTEVAHVRQDVKGARERGYGYCATHMGNVKRHLEAVLLNVYGQEKLLTLVSCCTAGSHLKDEHSAEFVTELLLEWTPHILLRFRKPISEYYQDDASKEIDVPKELSEK